LTKIGPFSVENSFACLKSGCSALELPNRESTMDCGARWHGNFPWKSKPLLRNQPPNYSCTPHPTNAKLLKNWKPSCRVLSIEFLLGHVGSDFCTFIGLSPVETKEKLGTFTKECKRFWDFWEFNDNNNQGEFLSFL